LKGELQIFGFRLALNWIPAVYVEQKHLLLSTQVGCARTHHWTQSHNFETRFWNIKL
jgi:hypothetical protein